MSLFNNLGRYLKNGKLKELTLTTNGSQLERYAEDLYNSGVRRINVSIDTLKPELFSKLTRRGSLEKVLKGIYKAKEVGLKIKINTVALKETNENELIDILETRSIKKSYITIKGKEYVTKINEISDIEISLILNDINLKINLENNEISATNNENIYFLKCEETNFNI